MSTIDAEQIANSTLASGTEVGQLLGALATHAMLLDAKGHYRLMGGTLLPDGVTSDCLEQRQALYARVVQSAAPLLFQETIPGPGGHVCRHRRLALPLASSDGSAPGVMVLTLASREAPRGLSERELEVFEHLGHGRSTQEIAEAMQVSPKTVESYRARIKTKLGIASAPELIRQATLWTEETLPPTPTGAKRSGEQELAARLEREIRSPLAALVGMADTLASGEHREPAAVAALIAASGEQLVRRLDRMLHASTRAQRSRGHGSPSSRVYGSTSSSSTPSPTPTL